MKLAGRVEGCLIVALVGVLLGAAPFRPLAAQRVSESRWTLDDARGSFCIWYLIDPAIAPRLVDRGTVLAPAGTGSNLPSSLAQTIRDEPRFTAWIPAAICVGLYGQVTIDDEKPIAAGADQPIAIVSHLIAATAPHGATGAEFLLIKLASDNRTVRKEAGDRGISMDGIDFVAGKDRGTPEDRIEFKLDGASILWIGHPAGNPSVGTTHSMSFGYAGARGTNWIGRLEGAQGESHAMIGALRVVGKGILGKALKSSPIRPTSPLETTGTAHLTFQIVSSRGSGGN